MSCGCQSPITVNNCCNQCACQCTCPTTTTSTTTLAPCLCYKVKTQLTDVSIPYIDCVTRGAVSSTHNDGDNFCAVKDSIELSVNFDYICTVSGTCEDNETCVTTTTTTINYNPPIPQTTFVPECGVIITGYNYSDGVGNIYLYDPASNSLRALDVPGVTGQGSNSYDDVAHTPNKLWLVDLNNSQFVEYDITLSPFSAVFNKNITFPNNFFSSYGLYALSDQELLVVNEYNIPAGPYVGRFNTTSGAFRPLFKFAPNQEVYGDFVLTKDNKFLVTTYDNNTGHVHLLQYNYITHVLEIDIDLTVSTQTLLSSPDGLFEYNGEIYILDGDDGVYKISRTSPYTITYIGHRPIGGYISTTNEYYTGASQASATCACCISFSLATTTTTTAAPTTTSTTSTTTIPCHCITFTNSSNTQQTIYYKPCTGGSDIQTTVPALDPLHPTTSGTVKYCGLVGGTYAPTYVTITNGANCVSGACPTTTTSSTTTTTTLACTCYTLSTSNTSQIAVYTNCQTGAATGISLSAGTPQKVCARAVTPATGLSIINTGGICVDLIHCPTVSTTSTSSTTSTTSTTTLRYPCNCLTFTNSSSNLSKQIGYTNCDGVFVSNITIPVSSTLNYCGTNGTSNDSISVFISEGAQCSNSNPCVSTTSTTSTTTAAPCREYILTNLTNSPQSITATLCLDNSIITIPVAVGNPGTTACVRNLIYDPTKVSAVPTNTACPGFTPPPPPPLVTTSSTSTTSTTSTSTTTTAILSLASYSNVGKICFAGNTTSDLACTYYRDCNNYYYNKITCPTLTIGCMLYTDVNLTIPLVSNYPYYSDGTNIYQISGTGIITNVSTCPNPPVAPPIKYQHCSSFVVPKIDGTPFTVGNITVTCSYTGDVTLYPYRANVINTLDVFPANSAWLGKNWEMFSLTFNFSQAISSINIYQCGGDVSESYQFTTNVGNPTLTAHYIANATIQGNKLFIDSNAEFGEGNSLLIVSNPTPFTSLIISGYTTPPGRPFNSYGSGFAICTQLVN